MLLPYDQVRASCKNKSIINGSIKPIVSFVYNWNPSPHGRSCCQLQFLWVHDWIIDLYIYIYWTYLLILLFSLLYVQHTHTHKCVNVHKRVNVHKLHSSFLTTWVPWVTCWSWPSHSTKRAAPQDGTPARDLQTQRPMATAREPNLEYASST